MKNHIINVPDFPIKGVMFRDITPILSEPKLFSSAIRAMTQDIDLNKIDLVVGVESRGFILASAIAMETGKGFVPIRKKGKLPPPVETYSYQLEYGQDVLEMKKGQGRVLLVDDVLATGGTIQAAIRLCERAGFQVEDISFLINLKNLNRFMWKALPAKSVVEYD